MKRSDRQQTIFELGGGWHQPPLMYEDQMKQYLIVKAAEGLNQVANWIAVPGLYTLGAAEQFLQQAAAADPESKFLIQEVGAA